MSELLKYYSEEIQGDFTNCLVCGTTFEFKGPNHVCCSLGCWINQDAIATTYEGGNDDEA